MWLIKFWKFIKKMWYIKQLMQLEQKMSLFGIPYKKYQKTYNYLQEKINSL